MSPSLETALQTRLRNLLALLDRALEQSYAISGLDYRPRFTPILRSLLTRGPSSIRAISLHVGITHSAVSQTVSQMKRRGLITLQSSHDGRERIVELTPLTYSMLPRLERHWSATAAAAGALNHELAAPLSDLLQQAIEALERRPFTERITAAALDSKS